MSFRTFLVSLLLLLVSKAYSVNDKLQISFENFPYMSQLPSNSIRRLFQDKEGYMWFGTLDGLCRYDGYQVKSFRSDMNNPTLLTNNEILCLTEDNENHLWIGTNQGLNILDKSNFKIVPFNEDIFRGDHISSLVTDNNGNIWIGSQRGLYFYNVRTKSIRNYASDPYDKKTISGTGVNSIYKDNHGDIWILLWGNGLCRYIPESDNFIRYPPIGKLNRPFRLYQDKKNNYWICTWGDGFFHFNPNETEEKMYTFLPVMNVSGNDSETTFYSIVQDDKYGFLWLMSLTGLYVVKYNENGTLSSIDISEYLTGSSKLYSEIIKDKDNNLWIGAFSEGAIFINFERPPVKNYSLDILRQRMGFYSSIKALDEDKDGLVWLGLNRYGLCLYDRQNNTARMYTDIPGLKNLKNLETVNYIREIKSRNEHWVCCNDNLIYAFRKNGNDILFSGYIDLNVRSGFNYGGDKTLFEDRSGNVWVGMADGVMMVSTLNVASLVLLIPSVTGITQDLDGNIWISSEQSGLCMLTRSGHGYKSTIYDKYSPGLNTNNVQSVCAHPSGKLWIGTKEGRMIIYDKKKNIFTDVSNLCAMTGEGILNILVDDIGNVWISTNKKVTRFNPQTETSTYYGVSDNIAVNSFIGGACSKSLTGEMLFGGNRGFCSFLPEKGKKIIKSNSTRVFITDVKVHNQSVFDLASGAFFDNEKNKLVMSHSEQNVEIEFSTLNYAFPSKIQYAYKLEGIDYDWNYVGNNRRFANYNNLRRGTYRFLLKATDENGLWSEKVTTLEIIKKPAFYETWWAKLCYLIVAAFLLLSFYRFTINRLRLRDELKIARIDREKSEELTQTKLRYFTNISHELLTPLTIISCLIDDLELSFKGKFWQYEVMKVNVNRLKRLLQQILDFRKVESGNMKLKVAEEDIVYFTGRICKFNFNPLAKEKQIHFSMVSAEESVLAWFDAEKLDIVLFNLLSNAFKYTSNGGSIRVDMERFTQDKHNFVRIQVSDTGRGISPADIENIFNRFYSNDPTNSVENHGIGLTLTKELLELHHASIRVDSEIDIGSIFTVEIPIDKEFYSENERIEVPSQSQTENLPKIGLDEESIEPEDLEPIVREDINVLIVEDNAQLRSLINKILNKRYNTLVAENGAVAMKVIEENQVDIVVSDIIMSEMDGLELCRTLKNNLDTSHIAILLLTAKNSDDDRIESYNAGADGYLSKPFELKVLEAKINSMVKNRKHKTEKFKSNAEINISSLEFTSIDERFLENAIAVIEEHLSEPDFDLDMFSGKLNMSKSSLYRKIKSLTGLSPVEFTKNIRLKHACQMLNKQMGNISDIAYLVGFADPKYFTSCFKAEFGMTPTEFVRKKREELEAEKV